MDYFISTLVEVNVAAGPTVVVASVVASPDLMLSLDFRADKLLHKLFNSGYMS